MGFRHLVSLARESSVGRFHCGIALSLPFSLLLLISPAPCTLLPSRMLLFSSKSTPSGVGETNPSPGVTCKGCSLPPVTPAWPTRASAARAAAPPTDAASMTGPQRLRCGAGAGDPSSFSSPAVRCRRLGVGRAAPSTPRGETPAREGGRQAEVRDGDSLKALQTTDRSPGPAGLLCVVSEPANELLLFANLTLGPASCNAGRSNQ